LHLAVNLLGYAPPPSPWQLDYSAALLPHLLAQPQFTRVSLLVTPFGAEHWRRYGSDRCAIIEVSGLDERKRRRFHAERYVLPRMLHELEAAAVFAPLGGSMLHPRQESGHSVRYVYRLPSLAYQLEPWRFSLLEQMFYSSTIPASCRAADLVIVDHPEMARAAAEVGIAPSSHISTVQPAALLPPAPASAELPAGLASGRFVLAAGDDPGGALERRLSELIAQMQLPRGWEDLRFVWCGRRSAESAGTAHPRLEIFESLEPPQYWALLRHCTLLLCLGSGESGLPPLRQALALGRPVLAVETPVQQAIAGQGAAYCALRGLASAASALANLLGDSELRAELAKKSLARGAEFSWQGASAQITQHLCTV
jgi:hypothetical protein